MAATPPSEQWAHDEAPQRLIAASAPMRVCDNGGWTDTWFAGHGAVCNVAVSPRVDVTIGLFRPSGHRRRILIEAQSLGGSYLVTDAGAGPGRLPLVEATLLEAGVPDDCDVQIVIRSAVPPGSSTGTSAAVAVALIAGLDHALGRTRPTAELAATAHRIEVDRLGLQSGIQDQISAAYGGINFIEMPAYPASTVTQMTLPDAFVGELDEGLALVLLGRTHVSSAVHDAVIAGLDHGPGQAVFSDLRAAARAAQAALQAGDLERYGLALQANTTAQAALHPALVNDDARAVIEVARAQGALGWKVNGAGGDGGSLTVLCAPGTTARTEFVAALARLHPAFRWVPTSISRDGALANDV